MCVNRVHMMTLLETTPDLGERLSKQKPGLAISLTLLAHSKECASCSNLVSFSSVPTANICRKKLLAKPVYISLLIHEFESGGHNLQEMSVSVSTGEQELNLAVSFVPPPHQKMTE